MAKKPKTVEKPLADRIAKARSEGRTQQALELARQLHKYEPTEAHQDLLRQVTNERGQHLQAQGMLKDAATVYGNVLTLGGSPEFRAGVIERLAACGALAQALTHLEEVADPAIRTRVLGQMVDAAVAQGSAGKEALPPALHAGFEWIVQAFQHSEAGRDEEARAALQGIGLQSPFLEWKMLLRGLLAYYANEDERARENWQRLDPQRLPFRVCAALRASIDPAFLHSQNHETQSKLRARMLQQQGHGYVAALQELRELLHGENLAPAFRRVELPVQMLRQQFPDLVARLGQCFFWAILNHGQPEDLERYLRVFGAPADDPHAYRLEAMALEMRDMMPEAHKAWQSFIADVAKSPASWPEPIGKRVQALIWMRMGENAEKVHADSGKAMPSLFGRFVPPAKPLKPDAEECLRKAIELAPDRLESHIALFALLIQLKKEAKAKKLGEEILKRFPEHPDTLKTMGVLSAESKDYEQAQLYFDRALRVNPLDRDLRFMLQRTRRQWAVQLTLAGDFDQARVQYEQARKLLDNNSVTLSSQWAVMELKAKNLPRAEELIAQARAALPHARLAANYALAGEAVRAKLPPKEKKRLSDQFKAALADAPTPDEIQVLLECAAQQRLAHDSAFLGQKTLEKTILKFLDKISFDTFSESQMERLCASLRALEARKPWEKCLTIARRRFLKNAAIRLLWVDFYLSDRNPGTKIHVAGEHLDAARRLTEAMPRGELQQRLLEQIQIHDRRLNELKAKQGGMFSVMDRLFGNMQVGPDDFLDDDDFEEDDDL